MFAQIFTGCKCGETWRVNHLSDCDIERDEVYTIRQCAVCFGTNLKPKISDDGIPHYHVLTAEDIYWERYSDNLGDDDYDDDYDYDYDDDDDYSWNCPTCGGENWDGGSSCFCEDLDDDDIIDDLPF